MAESDTGTTAEKSAETERDVTAKANAGANLLAANPSAKPASGAPSAAISSRPASDRTSASGIPLALAPSRVPASGIPSGGAPTPEAADITDKVATVTDDRPVSAPAVVELANVGVVDARAVAATSERRPSVSPAQKSPPQPPQPPSDLRPIAAYELLARSPKLGELVAITQRIVSQTLARAAGGSLGSEVASAVAEAKLSREDGDTLFGNVFEVLGSGGESAAERALASALWAHAVAESPRGRTEQEDSLSADVLWLATHTTFDATSLLDRALGEDATDLWTAIAEHVRRLQPDARPVKGPRMLGRGEAVVGCAALAASGSACAKDLAARLAREVKDPVLLRILATGDPATPEEVRIEGEIVPAPRSPFATTLLAFTGLLFAIHGGRLLARLALAYRCPAEVFLSDTGVRVKTRTELLGRTLREREHVILRSGLVRVVREVRFPRAAFYAGLLALALGSYIGVRAVVDGVRSASPSLLLVGLLIVAIGVGLDFVLGTVVPGSRGRCRIAFVPRTGPTLCVGDVDVRRADDALSRSLGQR